MAALGATLSTIDKILKDFYLPPVVEQLNNEVLLLQRLEARDQELVGKQAVVPLHKSRTSSVGARAEGDILPIPGFQSYERAVYDLKYLYGRFSVTGPSMVKSKNDAGAFLQVLKGEIDGLRNDLRDDLARQVYGSGQAGFVAQCGTTSASTTVTLASSEALRKGWIYVNMSIQIGTTADTDSVTGAGTPRTVSSVNVDAGTIVISGAAVTTSSSHWISRADASGRSVTDAGVSNEISSLQDIVPTAANSFGGINAASAGNEFWDNLRMGNSGTNRPLTLDLMQQAWSKARIAGGQVSSIITSYGLQRAFFNLLQSQIRYTEPMRLKGGFEALEFMSKPLIADIDAPYNKMFFLDERFLKVFSDQDWHFLDEDGHVLKWRDDYDEWQGAMARYMNLGASRRNTQLVLFDLTDSGF